MIPYGKQDINQQDIDAVIDVLKSDFLTQGSVLPRFEKSVLEYCGVDYGIATNSATSALHVACLALGVGEGSLVWTSAISFVASSNCALYCGANVDFVDIDPDTVNISSQSLEHKLQFNIDNKLALPDLVIVVHMAGQSCDMEGINQLATIYGFSVIEDASHAIGGKYKGLPVGSCLYSDICIFSFHPVKIITTGEGGIALTNSEGLAEKMNLYRSHGVTREESLLNTNEGPWYYEQVVLGFNYRMTEMQAALGLSQMNRLDEFVSIRTEIAAKYNAQLCTDNFEKPTVTEDAFPSWHLYILQLNTHSLDRKNTFERLRGNGLGVNVHYRPIYLNPYYQKLGFQKGLCPEAENYYEKCISIPLFHGMSETDQDEVVSVINELSK